MADNVTSAYLDLTTDDLNGSGNSSKPCRIPPSFLIEEDEECVLLQFFLNSVVGGIFCVLGLIGNSVSFAVLRKDKQTPIASMLLQSLALADNFFLFWFFVHISMKHVLTFVGLEAWTSPVWSFIHVSLYPFMFIGQTCTVWLTVFIAFTRYFAVCRPYSASRVWNTPIIRNGIIIITVCSFVYNIPRFFEYKLIHKTYCNRDFYPPQPVLRNNSWYQQIYFDYMYYIFSFGLPLLLLSVLNIRLIVAYRAVQKRRRRMLGSRNPDGAITESDHGTGETHRDPNITLVMIIVILIFILCNLPAKIVQFQWGYALQACLSYKFFLIELSKVLEVLNSATNFAVYCVFRQQFRTILRQGPCCPNVTAQLQVNQTDVQASQSLLNGNGKTQQFTCQDTKL